MRAVMFTVAIVNNDTYKGGQKLLYGFILGALLALLCLTIGFDSGYFSSFELFKYSSIAGGVLGLLNFIFYEMSLSSSKRESEEPSTSNQSSPSYDNYTDTSGGNDAGGGGGE